MTIDDCFKIGYISKTHGLKGEVTAVFEVSLDWNELTSLFLHSKGSLVPYFVERISGTADKPFLKFEGVETYEEAFTLKGSSIYTAKSNRPKLERGAFYDDEVIGFTVEDKNLGLLGQVSEIQSQGANRLLTIRGGPKEILIPINAPFITNLIKTKKLIKVALPDGFLEF